MNIFILSTLFFSFVSLALGIGIYLKRPDRLSEKWLIYCSVISIWGLGYSFQINNAVDYDVALWISRFADSAAIFIPITWVELVYEFLGIRRNKKLFTVLYMITFAIALTAPTPLFIPFMKDKSHIGFSHFVAPGPSFHVFAALYTFAISFGFIKLLQGYFAKDSDSEKKTQINLIFVGTFFGFMGGSTAFLPCYDIDWPVGYGTLLLPFLPIFMTLAIFKYRTFDMEELAETVHKDKLAALGVLAASINHEIKSPVYVIDTLAYTHLEKQQNKTFPDQAACEAHAVETLNKIRQQSQRVSKTIQALTAFAKRGLGKEISFVKVDLREVFDDIFPLIQYEFSLNHVALVRGIPEDSAFVVGDKRYLEEIFFNLLVNAYQAAKTPGEEIRIEIQSVKKAGRVEVKVSDNGPGIPEEILGKIFLPFHQSSKKEGTGLGLYICKKLVEALDGKIDIQSIAGKGTAVTLTFRAEAVDDERRKV